MAGYSKTPLLKKLGIKPGDRVRFVNAPENYAELLGPLPEAVQIVGDEENVNFIHFFSKSRVEFETQFHELKLALAKDGMLWISWPKKAAKVETDLDGNIVREFGLANGLVDVKVAAVDDIWSGLKFVYRLEDR